MRIIYIRQYFNVMCKISTFLPVNKICFCDIMLLLEAAGFPEHFKIKNPLQDFFNV